MTRNRLLAVIGRLPALALLLGLLVFGLGIALQYLFNRKVVMTLDGSDASPFIPIALGGLCIASLTLVGWFAGVGYMLARQTRRHGADYGQAYELMDAYQFGEAIPLLEHSIARGKESVEVLTLLARGYAYTGKYSKAHRAIERAIELYPNNGTPYLTLGLIFQLESNDEQAISALQAGVALDPSPINWADLGLLMVMAGQTQEALPILEKASQEPLPAPHAVRVYYHLMRLYRQAGDAARAESAAAKMISAMDGLAAWEYELNAVKGTGYGQRLIREVQGITRAIKELGAAHAAP